MTTYAIGRKIMFLLLLPLLLAGSGAPGATAEPMRFPAGTLLWPRPDASPGEIMVLNADQTLVPDGMTEVVTQHGIVGRRIRLYQATLGGRSWWLAPDQRVVGGRIVAVDPHRALSLSLVVLLFLAGIGCAARHWRGGGRRRSDWWLIGALLLFHFAWLKYLFSTCYGGFQSLTDDQEYFRIARMLLQWDFSQPFRYTLGYPLFCIPFALLAGGDHLAMAQAIGLFSALVVTPLNLILVFLLIRRITGSAAVAFGGMVLWMTVSRFLVAAEVPLTRTIWSPLGLFHSESIFAAYQFALTGFNSLSEWVSLALAFGSMLLAFRRGGAVKYALTAALFGLACLVRLNNVFLAPALVWACWQSDRVRLADRRRLAGMLALSAGVFLLVTIWQPVVNQIQFGNWLTFPYILHSKEIHSGFRLSHLSGSLHYYCHVFAWPLALALPALAVLQNRIARTGLALWTLPMTLFFCGFFVTGQHYRFLLPVFYGLTAAIAALECWTRLSPGKAVLLAAVLLTVAVPELPFNYTPELLRSLGQREINGWWLLWIARPLVLLVLLPIAVWMFRRNRQVLLFLALYLVLTVWDCRWSYLVLLLAVLLRAAADLVREVVPALRSGHVREEGI